MAQEFKTIGYLPTYRFHTINEIDLQNLTHLNIAFANPDINGNLTTNEIDISPIVQLAQEKDIEVFIALAGGAAKLDDWQDWIKPKNRSAFIHRILDYTKQHNLQGIDVDLEWGNVNEDYSGFVIELRDSMDQYDLKLSVALPGLYRYPEISNEALEVFDWINLMVYDLTGPWTPNNPGQHSPYSFAENAIDYWVAQGIDKSKMTLGVPFYGYDFTNQNNVQAVTFSSMVQLDPANAQIDRVGEIYYNGLKTIERKTILALNELSGIMIWELGQDNFSEFSLLDRISETINAYLSTSITQSENPSINFPYPNPVTDVLHLQLSNPQSTQIVLYSNFKKVMKTQGFINVEEISFDMSEFPSGMYFLSIVTRSSRKTFKLFKT